MYFYRSLIPVVSVGNCFGNESVKYLISRTITSEHSYNIPPKGPFPLSDCVCVSDVKFHLMLADA